MSFWVIIAALVVEAIAMGNALQVAMAKGQPVTTWQVWSAIVTRCESVPQRKRLARGRESL